MVIHLSTVVGDVCNPDTETPNTQMLIHLSTGVGDVCSNSPVVIHMSTVAGGVSSRQTQKLLLLGL